MNSNSEATMENEPGRGMTDIERRGRGCMLLGLLVLVVHLVALRFVAGSMEPFESQPWWLQIILSLCCLYFLWAAWKGNQFAFWAICIGMIAGIISMFIAVTMRSVPALLILFSVGMKALVLLLLLGSETRLFLAYQRRASSVDALPAGQE